VLAFVLLSILGIAGSTVVAGSAGCALAVARGHVEVLHVASADDDVPVRDVWVYRPPVPDSARLPVVYFLHGVPGTAADFFRAGGAAALDNMFASGVPPFVLAAPTGGGHARGDTEWADSVDGVDRVETYVTKLVVPAVEGSHPRDRNHRVLAGFSMGGYGAANLALRDPDDFGAAASFAGYFHIDDPDDVFGRRPDTESQNNPSVLVQHVRAVRFWLAAGINDTEPVAYGESQRFARLAGSLVAPGDLVLAPGDHSYRFVLAEFPEFGRFVARIAGGRCALS
jgi:S-formylglutathione hydrolase FrmB